MSDLHPALNYLLMSTQNSLESFELSRLNQASNLRKELRQVCEEWVRAEVEAQIARWILECRRSETRGSPSELLLPAEPTESGQLAMDFEAGDSCALPGSGSGETLARDSPAPWRRRYQRDHRRALLASENVPASGNSTAEAAPGGAPEKLESATPDTNAPSLLSCVANADTRAALVAILS